MAVEYILEIFVCGHHVYKSIEQPSTGEQLMLEMEESNDCVRYAIFVGSTSRPSTSLQCCHFMVGEHLSLCHRLSAHM